MNMPLLELHQVTKFYGPFDKNTPPVLDRISLMLDTGEALGLTGPSGSGKTTIARLILGIDPPDSGKVLFHGNPVTDPRGRVDRRYFSRVQIIWQDPKGFLNPYLSVLTSIMEPMAAFGMGTAADRRSKAYQLMEMMDLSPELAPHKPGHLSGGQCQRIAMARALSVSPELLICDEALVSLDLPQQVKIIHLLRRMQKEMNLGLLFISHDKGTVNALCPRVISLSLPCCQGKNAPS
jgi:ABC-type dipeptide/oligopeptide/nickel transport system ATPase subunit